ncbi:MAG: penicillin-binding protein [Bacilli bacterium]
MKNKKEEWKASKIFQTIVFLCLFFIFLQLSYISLSPVVYGTNMDEFAATRNTYKTTLYAKRGTIFDKDNNVLALNVSSYTVIAYLSETRTGQNKDPLHVVDKEKTAEQLSPILNMSKEYILELLNKDVYQVELGPGGRAITELTKEKIEKLKLPGISFSETYKRYYPNGNFASYILGYAKQYGKEGKETKIVGELGIESKYEKLLTGTNGYLEYQKDRYGYKIPDTKEKRIEAVDGSNVKLTIDSNIQRFIESAITNLKEYTPEWANITLMDAKTGEILGSSSIPSFDPNIRDITNYQSPLVTYTFEPGSTMKTFSYMCAIDSDKYDGNRIVNTGSLKIGDDTVRDWNRTGWGPITLDKGFVYSSNVAASTLVTDIINKSELRDCYEKYGFGSTTKIELPKEASGILGFTYPIEVATASFGQGITTTVLQQLQGLTIIANNGKMVKPHIVKNIINPNTKKTIYESSIEQSPQLVKTSTVNKMKDLLDQVVNGDDWNRTGQGYQLPGYSLIGKTGTAQISSGNGYLTGYNDYIHSFSGMYPKDDPKIIIYAAIKRPSNASDSGIVKAVKEIIINTTKYLNLFNHVDNNSNVMEFKLPSYTNKNITTVEEDLKSKNINIIKIGNGNKVVSQYPKSKTKMLSYDKVILITNGDSITLPSLIGWSKKELQSLMKLLKINYIIEGTGFVVTESIPPGTVITKDMVLEFNLANRYESTS